MPLDEQPLGIVRGWWTACAVELKRQRYVGQQRYRRDRQGDQHGEERRNIAFSLQHDAVGQGCHDLQAEAGAGDDARHAARRRCRSQRALHLCAVPERQHRRVRRAGGDQAVQRGPHPWPGTLAQPRRRTPRLRGAQARPQREERRGRNQQHEQYAEEDHERRGSSARGARANGEPVGPALPEPPDQRRHFEGSRGAEHLLQPDGHEQRGRRAEQHVAEECLQPEPPAEPWPEQEPPGAAVREQPEQEGRGTQRGRPLVQRREQRGERRPPRPAAVEAADAPREEEAGRLAQVGRLDRRPEAPQGEEQREALGGVRAQPDEGGHQPARGRGRGLLALGGRLLAIVLAIGRRPMGARGALARLRALAARRAQLGCLIDNLRCRLGVDACAGE